MTSYTGELSELIAFKIDPLLKEQLAEYAERNQISLSAATRLMINDGLAVLNCNPENRSMIHSALVITVDLSQFQRPTLEELSEYGYESEEAYWIEMAYSDPPQLFDGAVWELVESI